MHRLIAILILTLISYILCRMTETLQELVLEIKSTADLE